ncbi:MAG TPA: DUF1501 domain-containing protein [Gemmataceae bacterium]|jgi:uncharacterized protein (DUF1501 family)|nr:DUF1501 domain-containing protein [Gemmataceae bacterium]
MLCRREFLKTGLQTSTLIALAPSVPGFLAQTARAAQPKRDGRVLVVIQMDGGNDGINTVVPFKDDGYTRYRKLLRLPAQELIKVKDGLGLHPALADAGRLLEDGRLAIIQGVGYPNPNRSHFESMAIWQSGRLKRDERNGTGWIGRALDGAAQRSGVPGAVFIGGGQLPEALRGRRSVASALTRTEDLVLAPTVRAKPLMAATPSGNDLAAFIQRNALDAYTAANRMAEVIRSKNDSASYPPFGLADRLRLLARLIKEDIGARVFYTSQPGYDTHAGQLASHALLLREWAEALKAFLDDLAAARVAERVVVLCFSEFGRTVKENGSAGTDHGTAGTIFLAGPGVRPGLVGATPKLLDLDEKHGDLKVGIDFRQVYATLLEAWLGLAVKPALGGNFEKLPLVRA